MSVRFRIRTSAGQELSFATHEMFEDFVRAGDLSPDDLVYDVETGEWAPARTVPLVLEIEYEKEAAEEAAAAASEAPDEDLDEEGAGTDSAPEREAEAENGSESDAVADDTTFGLSLAPEGSSADADGTTDAEDSEAGEAGEVAADPGLGLELAPVQDVSPEEAAKAFVDKMEAERRDEYDGPDSAGIGGFTMEDPSTLAELSRATEPPPVEAPRREEPKKPRIARPAKGPSRKNAGRRVAALAIGLGVVGGGSWGALQLFGGGAVGAGVNPVDSTAAVDTTPPPPPPRQPIIASTESAVRERAQELLLTSTQALLRDLPPVPDAWTTGEYFSGPSGHPDVLTVWTDYLATIRRVRAGDAERYAAAYAQALDDAVIEGEARTQRETVALAAFATRDSLRAGHFDRVEALATAAIQSHNALLEAEGLILFDPTGSTGVQNGIGVGTSGRDTDAQLLLDQVLDLLSSTLDAEGLGPGDGSNVREWVWDGYLDAVTN